MQLGDAGSWRAFQGSAANASHWLRWSISPTLKNLKWLIYGDDLSPILEVFPPVFFDDSIGSVFDDLCLARLENGKLAIKKLLYHLKHFLSFFVRCHFPLLAGYTFL